MNKEAKITILKNKLEDLYAQVYDAEVNLKVAKKLEDSAWTEEIKKTLVKLEKAKGVYEEEIVIVTNSKEVEHE